MEIKIPDGLTLSEAAFWMIHTKARLEHWTPDMWADFMRVMSDFLAAAEAEECPVSIYIPSLEVGRVGNFIQCDLTLGHAGPHMSTVQALSHALEGAEPVLFQAVWPTVKGGLDAD